MQSWGIAMGIYHLFSSSTAHLRQWHPAKYLPMQCMRGQQLINVIWTHSLSGKATAAYTHSMHVFTSISSGSLPPENAPWSHWLYFCGTLGLSSLSVGEDNFFTFWKPSLEISSVWISFNISWVTSTIVESSSYVTRWCHCSDNIIQVKLSQSAEV